MKKEIKLKEKSFLNELSKIKIDKNFENKDIEKLEYEILKSEKKVEFYSQYKEKSNDFLLEYLSNNVYSNKLKEILKLKKEEFYLLKKYREDLQNIDKNDKSFNEIFKEYKLNQIEEYNYHKKLLKNKYQKGIISKKAYKNEINDRKIKLDKKLEMKKLQEPYLNLKNKIEVLKNKTKLDVRTKYEEINIEISDLRRKIKLDDKNTVNPILKYLTMFIPGLGQYILGEKLKSFFWFIGTIYIYVLAIPYSLGYSNYRGKGLIGLVTLAKGGGRLDRSIIFMIEGIIAIALILIALVIYYFSYKDVSSTIKNVNDGNRTLNKYEIKKLIFEEGFPYIVTNISGLLLLFIVVVPIMTTIFLSFTNMDPKHQSKFEWIGLKNYLILLKGEGIAGGPFFNILLWTLMWTLFATSLSIFVGFSLSLLAHNERIKGKKIIRTIYLLPWAVPAFITIMFFSIMTSNTGTITNLIEKVTGSYIEIKNNTLYTRMFLIFLQTWLGSSYVFLLSTGVLQAIPSDLYEAADIDGATSYQKLKKIIVPLVLMQTAPLLIGQYTFNFNNFSIIYLFNEGGPFDTRVYGNIAGSTDLLISYIYKLTIQKSYQSIGAAITVFISILLIFITYLGFKNTKSFKEN